MLSLYDFNILARIDVFPDLLAPTIIAVIAIILLSK